MSTKSGKQITCNRCGQTVFLEHVERVSTDGGYGSFDVYEKAEEWLYITEIGDLCPSCAVEFKRFVTNFMGGRVAPVWKYEPEVKEN